uniref:Uncharacterized protein n=1 Tax=Podarcis muralis TaxID=64176 RepID=A0A670IT41_PODMU
MWQCTVPNAVQPLPYLQVRTLLELHQELQSGHLGVEQSPLQADDSWALLAAPPNLKELVREEIRLLLIGLQQKASQEGRYWRLEEKGLERIKAKITCAKHMFAPHTSICNVRSPFKSVELIPALHSHSLGLNHIAFVIPT